jgi:enoyl-CoA hydratase
MSDDERHSQLDSRTNDSQSISQTSDSQAAVVVEERDSLSVIRLNRPSERNPLSVSTLEELESVVSALSTRNDLRALIFTGTDDVFASGANIRELQRLTPDSAHEFARRGQRLMQRIADAAQLTVAAVNGYCMGGGLDLALACDLRVAASSAVFAHPGARLGIITGWGGTQRLPRVIGAARALETFATARRLSAQEALDAGLVSHVGADALALALELVSRHR